MMRNCASENPSRRRACCEMYSGLALRAPRNDEISLTFAPCLHQFRKILLAEFPTAQGIVAIVVAFEPS